MSIKINGAYSHNLKNVSLEIPHNQLVVITGVSGSGKSSLAFDTVCREGQRRYLETFSNRARQLLGKLGQLEAESINNLSPCIALDQKTAVRNPRSTVGTISDLHNYLRLLMARLGTSAGAVTLSRRDFSFNSTGACEACAGLGVQDAIDPDLLVAEPEKTLREGALVITTDSGYIIYSQVTMDVLNQVCEAHGFHVDIPWNELTAEQKNIILYGSDRIEIPFGKHTLESRMKWSGITARPRQTGYYGGIIPVMEQILKRDRNKNILRFTRTGPCESCAGTRLNDRARSSVFHGLNIAEISSMSVSGLDSFFRELNTDKSPAFQSIRDEILQRTTLLMDLGLGYLNLDRSAPSLSGGEAQRIRLATIAGSGLRGITYVLDEPSIGLHPVDQLRLIKILRRLVNQGNSVIVVEHDIRTMLAADHLIDIGPGAGVSGGQVLFAGPPSELLADNRDSLLQQSLTRSHLRGEAVAPVAGPRIPGDNYFEIKDAHLHNLHHLNVRFRQQAVNVISGVSGAGKSTLLAELIQRVRDSHYSFFKKLITIDQTPIGRTPRSNAATYTGLFDHIRAVFAAEPMARQLEFGKGSFSFNNKGGRCQECEGAGFKRLGMHFLGDVEILCDSCRGQRFGREILQVKYREKNISEVLALPLNEAVVFFEDQPKIARYLDVLVQLGLGYLSLGQPSTTLSGGEAQRVKLAAELSRPQSAGTLYVLDEPTTGLHPADINVLLEALDKLVVAGGTVVVSEHSVQFLNFADWIIDLGPGSGQDGGQLVYSGPPEGLIQCAESVTGRAWADGPDPAAGTRMEPVVGVDDPIELFGVQTHNLKNVDASFPVGKITVVTGVSGSGKSSLAMDTLHAEGRNRYAENYSTYVRQQLTGRARADLAGSRGLTPTVAIGQAAGNTNVRSTVATAAGIHPLLRLLFSRTGSGFKGSEKPTAGFFSFNDHSGACFQCRGIGKLTICDVDKLVSHPEKSLLDGALDGHKTGKFYGEPGGQYVATLKQAGQELNHDFSIPWSGLSPEAREVAMHGAGDRSFHVQWEFKRGKNVGQHSFDGKWIGFCGLVNEEYDRKHADRRGQNMLPVMSETECPACKGSRYHSQVLEITCAGYSIAGICALSVDESLAFFSGTGAPELQKVPQLCDELVRRLGTLSRVGLGYLGLDRSSSTLSGGEYRRLQLARQLGLTLRGISCVLDEPTLGLHSRDTQRLWGVLEELRDQGNTLVLVEHDPQVIMAADHIIDMGPGAGAAGGNISAQGTPEEIMADPNSITGGYLNSLKDDQAVAPSQAATISEAPLKVRGARCHNLKNIDLDFPAASLIAITGVSGSGKTSLLFGTLGASAQQKRPVQCDEIEGLDRFRNIIPIRQGTSPGGRSASPMTAANLANSIRALLAGTDAARDTKLSSRHFSTAQKGGRCETCQGSGREMVSLDFMADVHSICPQCQGSGFTEAVLACRWHQRNISEILKMTVLEALHFFESEKKIAQRLQLLSEAGLSYVPIGQSTGTLSGGERQRLHLACRLLPGNGGPDLYLCDEPTAGLHMADISRLVDLLRRLTAAGHTVIFTEHNTQLIAQADLVLELGPVGGPDGGHLLQKQIL